MANKRRGKRRTKKTRTPEQKERAQDRQLQDNGAKINENNKREKQCCLCKISKPRTEFYKNRTHKDGFESRCKICHDERDNNPEHRRLEKRYKKRYYDTNKTDLSKKQRVYHYNTYFHLTLDEVQKIVDYQHGCCAMCGRPLPKPHIDHSHVDGLVRGALCWPCNRLLGLAHDNPELLNQALSYLADPPASRALGAPRYGLVGRVGTKKQRKLAKKLAKQQKVLTDTTNCGIIETPRKD